MKQVWYTGWAGSLNLHSTPLLVGNAGKLKESPFPDLLAVNLPVICIHISSVLFAARVWTGKGHFPAS